MRAPRADPTGSEQIGTSGVSFSVQIDQPKMFGSTTLWISL
jgi:hypothetical protein